MTIARESTKGRLVRAGAALALAASALFALDAGASAAASDFDLDFTGANPTTYDHSVGGGAYNDGTNSSVVESLEQQDISCGEIVTYLLQIVVDSGADGGFDHAIEVEFEFDIEGTNGNRAGHVWVKEATVNSGNAIENGGGGGAGTFGADTGHTDPGADAMVTSLTQVYDDAGSSAPVMDYASVPADAENLLVTVVVEGLDADDEAILAVDVLTGCAADSETGNIQAQVDGATDISNGGSSAVQVGAETVPFKNFGQPDEPANPAIDIQKTPDLQVLDGGGVVVFTITVTNIGDVDLTDTAVTDPLVASCARDATAVEGLDSSGGGSVGAVLSVAESFTYTCADEIAEGFTNTATASAMFEAQPVEDSDDAVVAIASIDITKTVLTELPLIGGGAVFFEITVVNDGEVRLRSNKVIDNLTPACGRTAAEVKLLLNSKGNAVGAWLAKGESFTYQCADEIADGYTNVAKANGRTEEGLWVTDKDTADVTVVNPEITITKSPEEQTTDGVVSFTITVENTGDLRLKGVVVTDELTPVCARTGGEVRDLLNSGGSAVGAWLAPGEAFTYECFDEVAESFVNTAAVSGETEGGIPVDDDDTAAVTVNT